MRSKSGAWGLLALGLMLSGCETVKRDEAGIDCRVRDSDGRLYIGQEYNQADSLYAAVSRCALEARDPTSCQELGCQYAR